MALNTELQAIKEAIIDDKTLIANAINDKTSGSLTSGDTFEDYASAIGNISGGTVTNKLPNGTKFYNRDVSSLDLTEYDFSEMKDASYIFANDINAPSYQRKVILPTNINTSNFDNMKRAFYRAIFSSDSVIDLSKFNVNNVDDFESCFEEADMPTIQDLSGWRLSSAHNCKNMFSKAKYSDFIFPKNAMLWVSGVDCTGMFENLDANYNDENPTLDFSNWNTSGVVNMSRMFYNISYYIKILNLSNWDLSNVTDMTDMFGRFITTDLSLSSFLLSNLGANSECTALDLSRVKINREDCLFLFNNAYDRATAGYPTFTITLHADAKARLSEEDIAIATAKGFTIA